MRETGRQLIRQTETKTEKKEVTESVRVSERERVERDREGKCVSQTDRDTERKTEIEREAGTQTDRATLTRMLAAGKGRCLLKSERENGGGWGGGERESPLMKDRLSRKGKEVNNRNNTQAKENHPHTFAFELKFACISSLSSGLFVCLLAA